MESRRNELDRICKITVDAAIKVHRALGRGLLESVYEMCLEQELISRGLMVSRQQPYPVEFGNVRLELGFRADMVVEDSVILEIKSVEQLAPVHKKQLLTYLKVADKRVGLLLNFGAEVMKDGITRVVNDF